MPGSAAKFAALAAGAGALAGIAYTAIAISRVEAFRKRCRERAPQSAPPVSVLKPLFGDEPELFENLASFCEQDYPEYEIIFTAADPGDPALETARAVAARFPNREIHIVSGSAKAAGNPKIGNLLGAVDRARHPIVLVADSDIRVGGGYLRAVAGCFADPQTGAATCIYGGVPRAPLSSRLGAMHVNDQFAPSVMVATALEPLTYCFGATMAVRAHVLREIGGLEAVADHLADDYLLGKLVTQAGYRVALVPCAVQTTVSDRTLADLWRHELRWARAILGRRPAGYAGSVVTYALPLAAACAAASRTPFSAALLGLAAALRFTLHYRARGAFAPETPATPWLVPLRDLFGFAVWTAAFFGGPVRWKDRSYLIEAGGRMAEGPREL